MQGEELFASVFVLGIFAGVFVIFIAMRQRSQQLEMQHRERMAMIERGQVPTDSPHPRQRVIGSGHTASGARSMSLGIVVIAVGLGLMTLVSIAGGSPEAGVGVGGAIVIVGIAFIVNSLVTGTTTSSLPPMGPPPPPRSDDLT